MGGSLSIPQPMMMAVDGVLLLGLLAGRPWKTYLPSLSPKWLVVPLIAASVATPWLRVKTVDLSNTDGPIVIEEQSFIGLSPEEWIDMSIDETPLAKVLPEVKDMPDDGTWVFWRWTCDHCAEHLLNLAQDVEKNMLPIVLIRVEEAGDNEGNRMVDIKPEGGHVYELALPPTTNWAITTPSDLEVMGRMVISARDRIELHDDH